MKKVIIFLLIMLVMVMLSAGCSKDSSTGPVTKTFDFKESEYGFTGEFTDLPPEYEQELYQLSYEYAKRPTELGSGKALRLKGANASDDLFMYIKKQLGKVDGLKANTTYRVVMKVNLASNAPAGAVGIGGPPGESVYVKVGAAAKEPVPVLGNDGDDWWRLNVDKGNQSSGGEDAVVVGDVSKPTNEDFETYEAKTLTNEGQPLEVQTDKDGNMWIFVGTDSGFEGITIIYYTSLEVTLTEIQV